MMRRSWFLSTSEWGNVFHTWLLSVFPQSVYVMYIHVQVPLNDLKSGYASRSSKNGSQPRSSHEKRVESVKSVVGGEFINSD